MSKTWLRASPRLSRSRKRLSVSKLRDFRVIHEHHYFIVACLPASLNVAAVVERQIDGNASRVGTSQYFALRDQLRSGENGVCVQHRLHPAGRSTGPSASAAFPFACLEHSIAVGCSLEIRRDCNDYCIGGRASAKAECKAREMLGAFLSSSLSLSVEPAAWRAFTGEKDPKMLPTACVRVGRWRSLSQHLQSIVNSSVSACRRQPDRRNEACQSLRRNGDGKNRKELLRHYVAAIGAFAKAGEPEKADACFQEISAARLDPDLFAYTGMINAHARTGDVVGAQRWFQESDCRNGNRLSVTGTGRDSVTATPSFCNSAGLPPVTGTSGELPH